MAAALLHDLGHWPFCHPIEDMRLPSVPSHELFANSFLLEGEIGDVLRHDWGINPREVVALLSEKPRTPAGKILASMLSGPIDIDKMDYLYRDSLHAGVPYGRHFDQQRLLGSLCLNQAGDGLAVTNKGRTAAELMVFARYVMFSEVYWHHGVRAATAMLQRAFYLLHGALDLDALFRMTEHEMIDELQRAAGGWSGGRIAPRTVRPDAAALQAAGPVQLPRTAGTLPASGPAAVSLAGGLRRAVRGGRQRGAGPRGGPARNPLRLPAGGPGSAVRRADSFPQGEPLAAAGRGLAGGAHAGHRAVRRLREAGPGPPVALEVQFNVRIHFPKESRWRPLGEVSPVVHTLATEQFDNYVKRVRVFAHPRLAADLRRLGQSAGIAGPGDWADGVNSRESRHLSPRGERLEAGCGGNGRSFVNTCVMPESATSRRTEPGLPARLGRIAPRGMPPTRHRSPRASAKADCRLASRYFRNSSSPAPERRCANALPHSTNKGRC